METSVQSLISSTADQEHKYPILQFTKWRRCRKWC